MENKQEFFASQLMVLTVLEAVKAKNKLNAAALVAVENAQSVALSALDQLIKAYPELEAAAPQIVKTFSSSDSKKRTRKRVTFNEQD